MITRAFERAGLRAMYAKTVARYTMLQQKLAITSSLNFRCWVEMKTQLELMVSTPLDSICYFEHSTVQLPDSTMNWTPPKPSISIVTSTQLQGVSGRH